MKWLWTWAGTDENFWSVFILRNLSIARSRRRKGWWEFSARLFSQRTVTFLSGAPICFRATP